MKISELSKDSFFPIGPDIVSRTLNQTNPHAQLTFTFKKDHMYELCIFNEGSSKNHVFLEFPSQHESSIGSSTEINEGVSAIQYLGEEIERTAQTVKESIEKTAVFDQTYDDMETFLYASFFIKAAVLLLVCTLQCWLFMKLMGKKTLEYKRVSIPI